MLKYLPDGLFLLTVPRENSSNDINTSCSLLVQTLQNLEIDLKHFTKQIVTLVEPPNFQITCVIPNFSLGQNSG